MYEICFFRTNFCTPPAADTALTLYFVITDCALRTNLVTLAAAYAFIEINHSLAYMRVTLNPDTYA